MGIGGTELNALRTAERLDDSRFDVSVICLQDHGPLLERYRRDNDRKALALLQKISPVAWQHIHLLGHYTFRGDKHAIVSAHYDSVWRGNGAIDNATGVEGVRRVGEALVGRDLEHGVRLIGFAAEEIKLTGSRYYVDEASLREELDDVLGVVNLDCIGHGEKLEILASPDALLGRAIEAARSLGLLDRYVLETGPGTGGVDSHWFAERKVPAATILHFPYDEYHLPSDLPALVDERQMDDAIALAIAVVESQLARPIPR